MIEISAWKVEKYFLLNFGITNKCFLRKYIFEPWNMILIPTFKMKHERIKSTQLKIDLNIFTGRKKSYDVR